MPKRKSESIPPLKRKREKNRTDRAYVWLDGKRHYLGQFGSVASQQAYNELIATWLGHGRQLPDEPVAKMQMTINQLLKQYWIHCKSYYVKNGKPTDEQACIKGAIKPLRELFGDFPIDQFSAPNLMAVQQAMVARGNSRSYINKSISRIKRCFKWGVKLGIVDPVVAFSLQTVDGLQIGRTEARETKGVTPVCKKIIDATLPKCSPVVQAMIKFQLLTGCRPGELCVMRPLDICQSQSDCWIYQPHTHKTEHHGKVRTVYVNFQAQKLIANWMKRPFVFMTTRNRQFKTTNYRERIWSACDRAKVARWNPNQLRHTAATNIRKQFGVETAAIILGHSKVETTQIYAEKDEQKAKLAIRNFLG